MSTRGASTGGATNKLGAGHAVGELVLARMFRTWLATVFELSALCDEATKWAEIDTIEDLELAAKLFPAMEVPGG